MFHEIDQLNDEIWLNGANAPQAGLEKAQKAFEMSRQSNYLTGQAYSLLNIGRCRIFLADLDKAREILTEALDLYRNQGGEEAETGEMRTLNALGVACFELQEYENSLNYYFMALSESEISKNDEITILTLNNIGEIHRLLKNNEEALGYYHRALNLAEQINYDRSIGTTDINLGEVYLSLNDLVEAGKYFNRAMKIAEKNNYLQMKADALLGKGKIMLQKENTESGTFLNEALLIFEQLGDLIRIAECKYQLGHYNLLKGKHDEASELFLQASSGAEALNQTELLGRCMLRLSELKKKQEDYRAALEYYEKYNELHDSVKNEGLRNRLQKITILYETEQTVTEKEAYRMQSLRLEKSNREIKFINEIGRQITSSLDLEDIMQNTFTKLSEIVEINSFGVALYDEQANKILFSNIIDEGEKIEPFTISADEKMSLAAWCIKNRKAVLVNEREDAKKYIKRWKMARGRPSESAVFMPMEQQDRMIGCLTIQNYKKNVYSESDLDTIGAVSTFLAIALDNSRILAEVNKLNTMITNEKKGLEVAYRKIAHMANHDTLTDLPNRHLLQELAQRGLQIAERSKTRLAILYMDLDNFKPVNDTLGHECGDEVLKTVSARLIQALRTSDTVSRVGGDEFVAVLYNVSSRKGIQSVARKIIQLLGEEINLKGRSFNIGVSIGISIYPDDAVTMTDLLLKADQAMYRAKQEGKTRSVFSGDL